jgi:hypothetical protein
MSLRLVPPLWGFASTFVLVLVCAAGSPADAQPKKPLKSDKTEPAAKPTETPKKGDKGAKGTKEQNFNFDNLNLNGRSRSPQLLYFLERANEELERASLEKRSFIPHMLRTVDEEAL